MDQDNLGKINNSKRQENSNSTIENEPSDWVIFSLANIFDKLASGKLKNREEQPSKEKKVIRRNSYHYNKKP